MFVDAFGRVLADESLDGSLKALALSLPAEKVLGQEMKVVDVDGIHRARRFVLRTLAEAHESTLRSVYDSNHDAGPYRNDKASIDRRRLKNTALAYLSVLESEEVVELLRTQFAQATNMTDSEAALSLLANTDHPARAEALAAFYERWSGEPLVVDKWFMVQAMSCLPGTLAHVKELLKHEAFTLSNPNRIRSLVGAFAAGNQVRFHDASGAGYELLADIVLELDALNPQVTSRIVSAFNQWKRFDEGRRASMQGQLERIRANEKLSRDVFEIVSKALD